MKGSVKMPFEKIDVKNIIEDELKNDDFRRGYLRLKEECELIEQLVLARKSMNITQAQLAKRVNVSQQAISRLEKEKHIPKMDTLFKIINGLGLRLNLERINESRIDF